jgi:hypothetical protein
VQVYALVELGDQEAIDVFIRREDAFAALRDCLRDEPGLGVASLRRADRTGRTHDVTELGGLAKQRSPPLPVRPTISL